MLGRAGIGTDEERVTRVGGQAHSLAEDPALALASSQGARFKRVPHRPPRAETAAVEDVGVTKVDCLLILPSALLLCKRI